jgi:hypothetical protein
MLGSCVRGSVVGIAALLVTSCGGGGASGDAGRDAPDGRRDDRADVRSDVAIEPTDGLVEDDRWSAEAASADTDAGDAAAPAPDAGEDVPVEAPDDARPSATTDADDARLSATTDADDARPSATADADAGDTVSDGRAEAGATRTLPDGTILLGDALPPLVDEASGDMPAIAVGADGLPVVAWSSIGPSPHVQRVIVQRWTGAIWETVAIFPDAPSAGHLQQNANLAFDAHGNVIVAWTDQDIINGPFAVHVRVRDGATWQSWDDGLPAGYRPYLVVDDVGDVSLSMTLGPGMDRTVAFRRQGASWTALGDLANANLPRLQDTGMMAGDGAGALEVVWSDLGATKQFAPERRRWEGGVWTSPAAPMAGANAVNGPVGLRVGVSHTGTVAFSWGELATGGLAETAAVFMPGWTDRRTVTGFVDVDPTDIDVDPAGLPLVTFTRYTPRTVQVERWSGTAWEAVFDGVQVSPRPEGAPVGRLALSPTGRPFLALEETAGGRTSIYVLTRAQ